MSDYLAEDVAIVVLAETTAQELIDRGVRALGLENVILEGQATRYVVYAGYPGDQCGPFDPPSFFFAPLDKDSPVVGTQIHVALGDPPPGEARWLPVGISGCSIWAVLPSSIDDFVRLNGGPTGTYDPANLVKIVGVQRRYDARPQGGDHCVGTTWGYVAAGLRLVGPEVSEAVSQHFPGVPVPPANSVRTFS